MNHDEMVVALHSNTLTQRRPRSVTRAALLDKARDLIRSGEPLTTVSLTRAVGVSQPAFYAHFRSVEECEREVFAEVCERLRAMHSKQRRTLLSAGSLDLTDVTKHLEFIIGDLMDNAVWFEIAQRRRHDISAMGEVVRAVEGAAREELAAEFLDSMHALGVPGNWQDLAPLQAELLQSSVNTAVDSLLTGRQTNVPFVARTLAKLFVGSLRLLAEPDPA